MKSPKQLLVTLAAAALVGAGLVAPALAGTPAAEKAGDTPLATLSDVKPESVKEDVKWHEAAVKNPRIREIWAYSPAMEREIPLMVLTPKDNSVPRPIYYLLNGGDGGEDTANWFYQTDVVEFFEDKNVWVVIPMAGAFSYYTDWVHDAPTLGGKQMWETFLVKELPGPLEAHLGASDKRALSGMSMTGTTSLLYAEHHPGFYDAIGSFSGCAETTRGLPLEYVRLTLDRGGASPEQMWGPIGGETFVYNDALINAERLRGQTMYISSGTGLAGPYDLWSTRFTNGGAPLAIWTRVVEGGIIEAATNKCTHDLKAKLDGYGIDANWNLRPVGTHSWGYWQEDLVKSWPMIARAFNMDPDQPNPQAGDIQAPITVDVVRDILTAGQGAQDPALPGPAPAPAPAHAPAAPEVEAAGAPAAAPDQAEKDNPPAPAPAPEPEVQEPKPEDSPAPAPAPQPEPAPAPQPQPAPAPAPAPEPAPVPAPGPVVVPDPIPAPEAQPAPVPAGDRIPVPAIPVAP